MNLLVCLIIFLLIIWAIERFYLRGPHPRDYPVPGNPDARRRFTGLTAPSTQFEALVQEIRNLSGQIAKDLRKHRLQAARSLMDSLSDKRHYTSGFHPVDAGGVKAEWVLAPNADGSRRVLYIHGGGFMLGSAKSHRTMTNKFSEVAGCAVLAIDYRLLPEYHFMDAVMDCRRAYQWMLDNGPQGFAVAKQTYIAGDSAGGNLALSLAAWLRENRLRLPAAVVAMSPLTDSTFSGASTRENLASDIMLAPVLGLLVKLPRFIKSLWVVWGYRVRPANPVVSPLLGDLSGLPPILVQASEAEMLLDDARRYVYKARASGTPAVLQTWPGMPHVWQIFDPELPQAGEAWLEIGKFIAAQTAALPDSQ